MTPPATTPTMSDAPHLPRDAVHRGTALVTSEDSKECGASMLPGLPIGLTGRNGSMTTAALAMIPPIPSVIGKYE